MVPVEGIWAESFDQIGLPSDCAIELARRECAALEINEHSLAVRGGPRVAARTITMLARLLRSKACLPEPPPRPIERQHGIEPVNRGGEIDALIPDDGRGAPLAGQGRLPKDLLELHRIGSAFNAAVVMRTAPAGPVTFGGCGRQTDGQRQHRCGELPYLAGQRGAERSHILDSGQKSQK